MSCDHQFDLSEGRGCVKCGFDPTARYQVKQDRDTRFYPVRVKYYIVDNERVCPVLAAGGWVRTFKHRASAARVAAELNRATEDLA